ncbi:glycosyl transferase possibly involved in lipopolysaccharide synthesis [Aequorivita sublithincola DSM 14238]|uniref:Glycosyl transferase possibly involved in lipopolysaccharide synthesis n=2 Tax=Aequorivita TaxID=153265 RepID=I3YZD3_AEQSU|nr:glycosyl transferase possibly involved in lipopolysaccharide synthesis [Aequorivita sublithincola DSM 14238]
MRALFFSNMYKSITKPTFDFFCALLGLLVLSPIFLIAWIGLAIANNGKPFFYQRRPGKRERIFTIIKFKTMNDKRSADGQLLPDAKRLTAIGSFVRKTSLDELPQLLNVLKGDMSFVGPRPLLPEYLPLYSETQRKRHNVKPGITGWAQVNGRNAISWEQKFAYDVWYVAHQSFALDLQILFRTVKKVFKSEGISQTGQVTTERFLGNAKE